MADDQDIGETTYVHSSPGPCMSCCICSFVSGCCRFIWKWVLVEDVMVEVEWLLLLLLFDVMLVGEDVGGGVSVTVPGMHWE